MSVELADAAIARVAAAIAEPARARMLCNLMDGRARTSTELAVIAEVSPSTASVHLARLKQLELVKVMAQGKHRIGHTGTGRPRYRRAIHALWTSAHRLRLS